MLPTLRCNQYDTFPHPECGKCGRSLDYDFNYCPGCGEKIEWADLNRVFPSKNQPVAMKETLS